MKNKYLVTIIVAIYNGQKYLKQCIDSILNQDYSNLEIILVDDGSPDNCGQICDDYAKNDKRIKVIHQKNSGVSVARNIGLSFATGDYICIVDQDDYLEKDYIDYLLKLIIKYNSEISYVPQVIMSTEKKDIYNERKSQDEDEMISGEKAACEMLYGKIEIGPWNKLISLALIKKNNIEFHKELFGGEGYAFSVECFMAANRVSVGYKGVYHYRIDNFTSEMSKFRIRTAESSFKAIDIMKKQFETKNFNVKKALDFADWNVYSVYLNSMVMCDKQKEYFEEYKKWKKELRKNSRILINSNITLKRKIKGIIQCISPVMLSKISNMKQNGRVYKKEK